MLYLNLTRSLFWPDVNPTCAGDHDWWWQYGINPKSKYISFIVIEISIYVISNYNASGTIFVWGHTEANLSLHSRYCGPDSGHRIHHGCHWLRGVSKGQYFDMCWLMDRAINIMVNILERTFKMHQIWTHMGDLQTTFCVFKIAERTPLLWINFQWNLVLKFQLKLRRDRHEQATWGLSYQQRLAKLATG